MKRIISIITLLVMAMTLFSLNVSAANNVSANMNGSLSGSTATFIISMSADGLQSYEMNLSAAGGTIDSVSGSGTITKSGSSYKVTLSAPSNSANLVVKCTKTSDSVTLSASSVSLLTADSGSVSLNVGLSQTLRADTTVVAPTEATTTYKEKAYLSMLTVNGYSLSQEFDPYTYTYDVSIPHNVNSVDVGATVDKSVYVGSTVTVDGADNLSLSNNTIYVTVTSQEGEKTVYTIRVNQAEKEETTIVIAPSSNNKTDNASDGGNTTLIAIISAAVVLVIGAVLAAVSTKRKKDRAEKFLGTQYEEDDDIDASDSNEINIL